MKIENEVEIKEFLKKCNDTRLKNYILKCYFKDSERKSYLNKEILKG